jgi:thymus-specific serine protease
MVWYSIQLTDTMMRLLTPTFLLLLLSRPWFTVGIPQMRYRDIQVSRRIDLNVVENEVGVSGNRGDMSNDDDDEDERDVEELYITQRLDHFDSTNEATYQQRYFVSYLNHRPYQTEQTEQNSLPILNLLCVGGEGPGFDKSVLVDSVHCTGDMLEVAKQIASHHQFNLHIYALEHRYYGKSYPTFESSNESPLTTKNLKYLSSLQALEDLAHFVQQVNQNDKMSTSSTNAMWITFGGSYPGMLALYARYKYPHLIMAAVSSSAPIGVQINFHGYKAKQGWDLKYSKVGGSVECHRIVKAGHEQAVSLLQNTESNTTDGPQMLATKFNLCNPSMVLTQKRNQELLLGDGLIDIPAQGNDPSCSGDDLCNIDKLCQFMIHELELATAASASFDTTYGDHYVTTHPELEVLAKVAQEQRQYAVQQTDENCLSVDFQAMLEEVTNTDIDGFGWRSWLYQTCSEFGFYQTCGDDCPFASHFHNIDLDLEICEKAFNITTVYDNVQATLDRYGGLDIVNTDASRILSVNGNVDPWSVLALSKNDERKYSLPIRVVDGASHHFWTHPVKETDAPEIVQAREFIYSVIQDWIGIADTVGELNFAKQGL